MRQTAPSICFAARKYIGDSLVHYQVMFVSGNDVGDIFGFHSPERTLPIVPAEEVRFDKEKDDGRSVGDFAALVVVPGQRIGEGIIVGILTVIFIPAQELGVWR